MDCNSKAKHLVSAYYDALENSGLVAQKAMGKTEVAKSLALIAVHEIMQLDGIDKEVWKQVKSEVETIDENVEQKEWERTHKQDVD